MKRMIENNTMKTAIIMLLLGCLLFFFTACGKKTDGAKKAEDTAGATETVTEADTSGQAISEKDGTEQTKTEADETTEVTEGTSEKEEGNAGGAPTLLYQGHASIRITTSEGKVIYVDPFRGDGYDVPADLILMTHGHADHTNTALIEKQNEGCQTISWKEALVDGDYKSFDLGYVKVDAVEAYNENHDERYCVGYILTFSNGITLYLSGDTSTTQAMVGLAERNLDYAFFCCDGVYNMNVAEAAECARTVGAKHNIPYHMVPSSNLDGFDQSVAESFDAPGRIILQPGEELVLE